ncbi:uncharacterized protein BJ171DRAFT_578217 [Polychytrium aggregatum]|uniref:uncharacterized protein n=1 Tax=Polychytrium aggregatum TaxID=110093 RepID=UPI0022FDF407|nr:uncharacterized protein BJ171DRAFT_578217 [Polychytrium aggregatum]KAI9207739.1 hypothetical protein BJ171DRAFT_578217 [Polychytrium aggregatum]
MGADPSADSFCALRLAVARDWIDCAALILEQFHPDSVGNGRLLAVAAQSGSLAMVQLLIQRGADPRANSCIAVRLAASEGYLDIVQFLVGIVGPEAALARSEYALKHATTNGHWSVVEYLVGLKDLLRRSACECSPPTEAVRPTIDETLELGRLS